METKKVICPSCKGNGFTRSSWEGDEIILQCVECHSQGEIPRWSEGNLKALKGQKEEREWALATAMVEDHEDIHGKD